jgi:acylphosphatase
MSEPLVRRQVHFHGQVQGVGFRYTTFQVSAKFPVVGFVQNLPNGSVELVVEGRRDSVDAFINALSYRMRGYIQQTDVVEGPATGEFDGFNIRR